MKLRRAKELCQFFTTLYVPQSLLFIIVNSVLTVHIIWRNGWRKMHQNAQICMFQVKIFPGLCPRTPCWGGATAHLPQTPPPRHSGAGGAGVSLGASIVPQCLLAMTPLNTGHDGSGTTPKEEVPSNVWSAKWISYFLFSDLKRFHVVTDDLQLLLQLDDFPAYIKQADFILLASATSLYRDKIRPHWTAAISQ